MLNVHFAWAVVVAAALALSVPVLPAEAAPPTAAALIARYVAWRGGPAYERLNSIHMVLSLHSPSGPQRQELWLDRDGRARIETDFGSGALRQISVSGPDGAWNVNVSGQVTAKPRGGASARLDALLFGGALLDPDAAARLSGAAKVGDRTWPLVRFDLSDGDAEYAVIDPASGRLWTLALVHDGRASVEAFGDWRMVDGVRMPFYWMQEARGRRLSPSVDVVDVNPPLDPALFRKPAGVRLSSFVGGATSSGWIGFDLSGNAIYLPVEVDGHATTALLDTGASTSVVDRRLAASLGQEPIGSAAVTGAEARGGNAQFLNNVDFAAGALRLAGVKAAAIDLGPFRRFSRHPFSAILGQDAFNELVVDIDFARRRLTFLDPAGFIPPADAVALPLRPDGVLASVDGRPAAKFQVDLGYDWSIELFPDYVRAERLADGRKLSDALVRGVGGETLGRVKRLRRLSFAGLDFSDVPASFAERQPPGAPEDLAGRIGVGLLSRFETIIDYPQGRLYLVPAPDATTRPFERIPVEGFANPDPITNPSPCKFYNGARPVC